LTHGSEHPESNNLARIDLLPDFYDFPIDDHFVRIAVAIQVPAKNYCVFYGPWDRWLRERRSLSRSRDQANK
jgi:hypothetical protein